MSRTRKGLRAPTKKIKRRKVNPYHRQPGPRSEAGDIFFAPDSSEGRAIAAMMDDFFGPSEGRVVAVGMSDNMRL